MSLRQGFGCVGNSKGGMDSNLKCEALFVALSQKANVSSKKFFQKILVLSFKKFVG